LKGLTDELSFLLMMPVAASDFDTGQYDELEEKAVEAGVQAYRSREAEFTAPVLRDLERHLYLYTLDEHWRDHLYELDHLKGGIGRWWRATMRWRASTLPGPALPRGEPAPGPRGRRGGWRRPPHPWSAPRRCGSGHEWDATTRVPAAAARSTRSATC